MSSGSFGTSGLSRWMIAYEGELLVDNNGNYGVVLCDIKSRPAICERKILVSHPGIGGGAGYVSDITTRAWYRYGYDVDQLRHIFSEGVIRERRVI